MLSDVRGKFPQDVVALLLRNGASCHALSYSVGSFGGFTPADLASMHNHNGIAAYLSESHLAQMVALIGGLDISDDPTALFRKRHRNSVAHIGESAPEAEVEVGQKIAFLLQSHMAHKMPAYTIDATSSSTDTTCTPCRACS